jgi:hypothetical protein
MDNVTIEETDGNRLLYEKAKTVLSDYNGCAVFSKVSTWISLPMFLGLLGIIFFSHTIGLSPLDFNSKPIMERIVILCLGLCVLALISYKIYLSGKPVLEISETGIRWHTKFPGIVKFVEWKHVQGINSEIIEYSKTIKPIEILFIYYYDTFFKRGLDLRLWPRSLNNGAEAVSLLKQIIPFKQRKTTLKFGSIISQSIDIDNETSEETDGNRQFKEQARSMLGGNIGCAVFSYSMGYKALNWLTLPMALGMMFITFRLSPVDFQSMPIEARVVIPCLALIVLAGLAFSIYLSSQPVLEISKTGLRWRTQVLGTVKFAEWNQLRGISLEKVEFSKNFKPGESVLIYYSDKLSGQEDVFQLRTGLLKNGAEAVSLLKQIIPLRTAKTSLMFESNLSQPIDPVAAVLIISGVVIGIADLVILMFYPPTLGLTWVFPLLLIPFGLVPFVYTLRLLTTSDPNNRLTKRKIVNGAISFNLGLICALLILFVFSPSSYQWMMADVNAIWGDLDVAESHYKSAEKDLKSNADFLFAVAQFYLKKQDWANSAGYYIKAYRKDPTNWMTEPLLNIPESLIKAGQTEEAERWCGIILTDYPKRAGLKKEIDQIRKKIAGSSGNSK